MPGAVRVGAMPGMTPERQSLLGPPRQVGGQIWAFHGPDGSEVTHKLRTS